MKKLLIISLFISINYTLSAQRILNLGFVSHKDYVDFEEDHILSDSLLIKGGGIWRWNGSIWVFGRNNQTYDNFKYITHPSNISPGNAITLYGLASSEISDPKIRHCFFALKLDKPLQPGVETKFVFTYTNETASWGYPGENYYGDTLYYLIPEIYSDSVPNLYDTSSYDGKDSPLHTNRMAYFLGRLKPSGHNQWITDTLTVKLPDSIRTHNWLIVTKSDDITGIFLNVCSLPEPLDIIPNANITLNNVSFESDKSELLSSSFKELDQLVSYLKKNPSTKIKVSGYTDNTGTPEKNLKLSEDRAKAVADYLISKGLDKSRVSYKGYGSTNPIAKNDTEDGKAKNRRVEFRITTEQQKK